MPLDLPGLQQHVILAPFTTYRIGGPADYFVEPRTRQELEDAVMAARRAKIPYFMLGTGANILVGDAGFRGLAIRNHANHVSLSGTAVTTESGATIADLIDFTLTHQLSGLEHFAGIPSSVGGAIWQNLHFLAPNRQDTLFIESIVKQATIMTADNSIQTVDRDYFQFGYDDSLLHHQEIIVLDVTFQLTPSTTEQIRHQRDENIAWRQAKQPQLDKFPSCGSVFKKIDRVGAGRLIDQAGLKGFRIGDAQISHQHANFIVNLGHATAHDVTSVIHHVQEVVQQKFGYQLETEIGFVGEFV